MAGAEAACGSSEERSLVNKPEKDENSNIIQKSLPLMRLWKSPLTLPEFKLLDLYLSKVDSHHPENRTVSLAKGEIEAALGVKRILPDDLRERIRHLGIMIEVEEIDEFGGFRSVALLEEAACHRDQDGLWRVELTCTPQAMKYIFNIENLGYLRYKLCLIAGIGSRYSYLLFLYVERNRFRGTWEVEVDDLREYLGCDSEFYSAYKEFNRHVLARCRKELGSKASCHFTYEPIRKGRRVRRIRFSMESPVPPAWPATPPPLPAGREDTTAPPPSDEEGTPPPREYLLSVCAPDGSGQPEFSGADARHILALLAEVPLGRMPEMANFGGSPELRRMAYLSERYAAMNRAAQTTTIRNRASYLISLIRKDVE